MNLRELLNRLDELDATADANNLSKAMSTPQKGRYENGIWIDEPATIQQSDYSKYKELVKLANQYLDLVEKRKAMMPATVKENQIAKALMESFGYEYLAELAVGDIVTGPYSQQYKLFQTKTGDWYWGKPNGQAIPDKESYELLKQYPEVKSRMPGASKYLDSKFAASDPDLTDIEKLQKSKASNAPAVPDSELTDVEKLQKSKGAEITGKEASKFGKFGKFAEKAALPIAAAAEIYDGYEQIMALPKDLEPTKRKAEITKIVTDLVTNFGLFWVGSIIGASIAGVITGTGPVGGLIGFIAGGASGMAASYFLGEKGIDPLVNDIIDKLYGTSGPDKPSTEKDTNISGQTATWPTSNADIRAFQSTHKDENGKPLEVDGMIGRHTMAALKAAGANPPPGFVPVRDRAGGRNTPAPVAAQAVDTTEIDKQIADLKTQLQTGLDQIAKSKSPEVAKKGEELRAKLGTDFAQSAAPTVAAQKASVSPIQPINGPAPKFTVPAGTVIGN
jgi:hypothetical protein